MSVDHIVISSISSSPSCENLELEQKMHLLNDQIQHAFSLNKRVIVILGNKGDLWLRNCSMLQYVDICYSSETEFYTSIYDALEHINDRCFISPLCFTSPKRVWDLLENTFYQNQHRKDLDLYYYKRRQLSYPILLSPNALDKMRVNLKKREFTSLNFFNSHNCTTLNLDSHL